MIKKESYVKRRKELAERCTDADLIIIAGNELVQKSSDETYDFYQDGYFYYLCGINEAGYVLVINKKSGQEFLISRNESTYHNETWEVSLSHEDIERISGVSKIYGARGGDDKLKELIHAGINVASIVPKEKYIKSYGMYMSPSKIDLYESLIKMGQPEDKIEDISGHIRSLRTIKGDDEVLEIRNAIAKTKSALDNIILKLDDYTNECEVYSDISSTLWNLGSDHGYTPVVAGGSNAVKLHYKANNAPLDKDGLLLIDVGGTSDRYTADISRTYFRGKISSKEQDIYNVVLDVQNKLFDYIKPGLTMGDIEGFSEEHIGIALNKIGLIDNMIGKNIRRYYPHAFGHHLGVDVHDSCDYLNPLKPGAVITVEPGIYIPEMGIGVRIEDNILITENGNENLSVGISK